MSTIALHSTSNITERKPLKIEAWLQRTTNRKWYIMGYQMVTAHVTDDLTWPQNVKLVTSIRVECNILKTAGDAIQQQSQLL